MRATVLLCSMFLSNSLSPFSMGAVSAGSRSPFGGGSWCRCTPNQFEAVLRTAEREIDLLAGIPFETMMQHDVNESDKEESSESLAYNDVNGDDHSHLPYAATAESESTTSVYYDYANGLLATVEHSARLRTVVNHSEGMQYMIKPDGTCRRTTIQRKMKKMCLPDGAVLTAKFSVGFDQPISLWKFVGPNNSTLRTMIDRRRCIPLLEETFSQSDGYISLASTVYSNARIGIRDRSVFIPPPLCSLMAPDSGPQFDYEDEM